MDDDKPVDAAIRPVLPSRKGTAVPAFLDQPSPGTEDPYTEIATAMRELDKGQKLPRSIEKSAALQAPYNKEKPVTKKPKAVPAKPDKKRSAIAREAWKTRKARLGNSSPSSKDELGVLVQMMTLLERLPAAKRVVVLSVLKGLVS